LKPSAIIEALNHVVRTFSVLETFKRIHRDMGGAEEAGEKEGKSEADKCCMWAVGWDLSIR